MIGSDKYMIRRIKRVNKDLRYRAKRDGRQGGEGVSNDGKKGIKDGWRLEEARK